MFRNHSSSIHNLEVQVGQLVKSLSVRNQGNLPSNIKTNHKEHVKATTLRSGTELQPPKLKVNTQIDEVIDKEVRSNQKMKQRRKSRNIK